MLGGSEITETLRLTRGTGRKSRRTRTNRYTWQKKTTPSPSCSTMVSTAKWMRLRAASPSPLQALPRRIGDVVLGMDSSVDDEPEQISLDCGYEPSKLGRRSSAVEARILGALLLDRARWGIGPRCDQTNANVPWSRWVGPLGRIQMINRLIHRGTFGALLILPWVPE